MLAPRSMAGARIASLSRGWAGFPLSAQRGLATSCAGQAPLDHARLARVDEALEQYVERGVHRGASLLVAQGGNVVHRALVGHSAPGRPVQDDDKHMVLSLSKAFTAVLVLRAAQLGWFDLSTKVAELVPAFAAKGKEDATVEHLLCHMAGLPTATIAPPLPLQAMGSLDEAATAAAELDALYPPGEGCVYSSGVGFDVLGQVLVNADPEARLFNEIAQDELFAPLGMRESTFGLPVDDPARVPIEYAPSARTPYTDVFTRVINGLNETHASPSSGASTTARDVLKFSEMLVGRGPAPSILSSDLLSLAKRNAMGDRPFIAMTAHDKASVLAQLRGTIGFWGMLKSARKTQGATRDDTLFPANFNLLGGSTRGSGDSLTSLGQHASSASFGANGSGTSSLMHDPEHDVTVVFLAPTIVDGIQNAMRHVSEINDLVLAAVEK